MRKVRSALAILAVCAAALVPAGLTAAPALAAPAGPRINIGEIFYSQNVANAQWLHAHCVACQITTSSGGLQAWFTQDEQTWFNPVLGSWVTTLEFALDANHSECIQWESSSNTFILGLCVSGFGNGSQQFFVPSTGGTNTDWIINADATAHVPNHAYQIYATASSTDVVVPRGPGYGTAAEWAEACQNC
jgi:hypothetical protein